MKLFILIALTVVPAMAKDSFCIYTNWRTSAEDIYYTLSAKAQCSDDSVPYQSEWGYVGFFTSTKTINNHLSSMKTDAHKALAEKGYAPSQVLSSLENMTVFLPTDKANELTPLCLVYRKWDRKYSIDCANSKTVNLENDFDVVADYLAAKGYKHAASVGSYYLYEKR